MNLTGDSGYPLLPYILTPIRNPPENSPQHRFNVAHRRARSCIERCIGILKARFRCLIKERMLKYSPTKAGSIINACTILHNIMIHRNLPLPEEHEIQNYMDDHRTKTFLHNLLQMNTKPVLGIWPSKIVLGCFNFISTKSYPTVITYLFSFRITYGTMTSRKICVAGAGTFSSFRWQTKAVQAPPKYKILITLRWIPFLINLIR